MSLWRQVYLDELRPVRREWDRLAGSIRQGRIHELAVVCPEFAKRVEQIDRERLAAVSDPVVGVWLGRGLVMLEDAVAHCRADRIFALTHRLDKAHRVIQDIDRRVRRYP